MRLATRLQQRLAEGGLALGAFASLNNPESAEFLAHGTDLDFIGVDLQHAPISAEDSVHLLRALQAVRPDVTPIARLPDHGKHWIERPLDAGYVGLIVPLTESAAEAAELVRKAYYPPLGARSIAGSIRASLYEDYFSTINDQLILLPQIESAAGLANVEQIAAVPGVTGVLMGPADLSLSCGWYGEDLWSHPPFLEAAKRIVAACRDCGKPAAILTGGDSIYAARDVGFRMIGFGSTAVHIRRNMADDTNAQVQRLRSGAGPGA